MNAMADFLNAIASGIKIEPNFTDGVKEMAVLEAALLSAQTQRVIEVAEQIAGRSA